ncbi:rifin, partial [Plasmodium reichenowi]
MKLHCSKILLLFLPLNILAHNTNKPYITPHHTQTNRSLCECDTQSSNYDKDTGMKSVMQQFVDRTSQRFEEYKERLKDKSQKRKEERDKNIQKIIEKDKMEKSLEQKIEKGCLKCGCALGGGVLPVWGLVCGAGYAGWSQYVATTYAKAATEAGIEKGIEVGLAQVLKIAHPSVSGQEGTVPAIKELETLIAGKFTDGVTLHDIFKCINSNIEGLGKANEHGLFVQTVKSMAEKTSAQFNNEQYQPAIAAV